MQTGRNNPLASGQGHKKIMFGGQEVKGHTMLKSLAESPEFSSFSSYYFILTTFTDIAVMHLQSFASMHTITFIF